MLAGLVVVILDLPVIHFSHENCVVGSAVTFQPGPVLTVDVGSEEDDGLVVVVVGLGTGLVVVDDILVAVVSLLLSVDSAATVLSTT